MKNLDIQCKLTEFDSEGELDKDDQNLMGEARKSMMMAYAPYSNFHVGAAVLLENGNIIRGNNQENASYPIGLCAERVAIFAAGANFPGIKIVKIAITAMSDQFVVNKPVTPCGACRQAIAEYEHRYDHPIHIIMSGESGKVLVSQSINNLLPFQFTSDDLQLKRK